MIQKPSRIFFSRWEEKNEDNQWMYMSAYTLASAAKRFFFARYPDDPSWWQSWNVIELHGYDNPKISFVEYDNFGVHPFPKEKRRFVFYPNERKIAELRILDPYLLHESYILIPEKGMGSSDPFRNPNDRKVWFRRCEELYMDFEQHGLLDHPQSYFLTGWNDILTLKGIEVINLPDKNEPMRIKDWKVQVTEIHAECNFGDL